MKNSIIIIIFLGVTSAAHSQNTMYNGNWNGEVKNQDTSFTVNFGIFSKLSEQKNTIIGAIMYKPESGAMEENLFNDSILKLKPNYGIKVKPAARDIEYKGPFLQEQCR